MIDRRQDLSSPPLAEEIWGVPGDRLREALARLWAPGGVPREVSSRVDPAIFSIRRRILEEELKALLADPALRALPMDSKRALARRMAKAVWRGYLLAVAHEEATGTAGPRACLVDPTYLWEVFRGVTDGDSASRHSRALEADPSLAQAIASVETAQLDHLRSEIGTVSAVQSPAAADPWQRLGTTLRRLATRGFLIRVAQREALGR